MNTAPTPDPPAPSPRRALIVEDDAMQRDLLTAMFAQRGYIVDTACDGLEGFYRILEQNYDLAILDQGMPKANGQVMARLVHDVFGEAARPTLIAFTASPERLSPDGKETPIFDAILSKSGGLEAAIAEMERFLALRGRDESRRRAEYELFMQRWEAYDDFPGRPDPEERLRQPTRILVVEDDPEQARLLSAVLARRGCDVDQVADGVAAIRLIRSNFYDIVLMDFQLPEMDGLSTTTLLANLMPGYVFPRIIAVTANPDKVREELVRHGGHFSSVVGKSEGLGALIATVDKHLAELHEATAWQAAARRNLAADDGAQPP
jgi:CheY-like chemotaxis protein